MYGLLPVGTNSTYTVAVIVRWLPCTVATTVCAGFDCTMMRKLVKGDGYCHYTFHGCVSSRL